MKRLNSLLRLAAISGVEVAVSLHIRRGDDLDARDESGATPLILAAARRRKGVVKLLLEAGANPALSDSNGKNALDHALGAGCSETISLLAEAMARLEEDKTGSSEAVPVESQIIAESGFCAVSEEDDLQLEIEEPDQANLASPDSLNNDLSGMQFAQLNEFEIQGPADSLSDAVYEDDWVAEEELSAPEGDVSVLEGARQVHEAIGRHRAIDGDKDWSEINLSLPSKAVSFQSAKLEDGQDNDWAIRVLLLAALREGIVSENAISDVCSDIDGERNEEAERLLGFVVTELGAAVVEWAGKEDQFRGKPSSEEEAILDEAMDFLKDLSSKSNDPFRFYSKDIRGGLLEAAEEISLGRTIEEAGNDALVALAGWPKGLEMLYAAADKVEQGVESFDSFSAARELLIDSGAERREEILSQGDDDTEVDEGAQAFVSAVGAIRAAEGDSQGVAEALKSLGLKRGFLWGLAAHAELDSSGAKFHLALRKQSLARDRMVVSNLRLALSIAKKYAWSDLPFDDLVQEANIGLMKAVDRYDWRKGFRFSTYATWWIRQQVSRSIADTAKVIRAPVHVQEAARKVLQEREKIEADIGRSASLAETARRVGMPPSKVELLMSVFSKAESLDENDPEAGFPAVDLIVDPEAKDPADIIEQLDLRETLMKLLGEIDDRSRHVILLRFGLESDDALTLEDVGKHFDVTRERIRQIESKALRKLAHQSRRDILAPFMGDAYSNRRLSADVVPAVSGTDFGHSVSAFGFSDVQSDVFAK